MTQDEIIRMAREAGLLDYTKIMVVEIERFAALVAANAFNDGFVKGNKGLMEAVREEREACAKVCDDNGKNWNDKGGYCRDCAAAIRARGEK